MSYLQASVLGLIQGLTEFLPVSSSAHLTLAPWLFNWSDPGLTFDVALHAGTLVAVLAYFWRDWLEILGGAAIRPRGPQGRLFAMLVVATLPAVVVGLLFEKKAEEALRSPLLIAGLLAFFGLLMDAADRLGRGARSLLDLSWPGAIFIGCAQALALAPGVSRSGVTMTAALALGLAREDAARFSFLLATPVIAGAAVLKLRHLTAADVTGPFLVGVGLSAVSGLLAVGFLLSRIRRHGVRPYAIYRLAAAAAIVAVYAAR